jgi:hypothetical protein
MVTARLFSTSYEEGAEYIFDFQLLILAENYLEKYLVKLN